MSSLFGTMGIAVRALLADQGALEATANNVANANTPGFSRQRPVLVEGDPVVQGSLTFGTGVVLQKLESLRDPILEMRIQQETQQQGQQDAFVSGMQQIQVMFNSSSGDIGTQISNFFASVNQLSTDPANISLRQGVLTAAGNLANTFNVTVENLTLQRSNLDLSVTQAVQQVNGLTEQIAGLNGQINAMENLQQDASALIDKRNVLINQLSGLVDVSTITTEQGLSLTTSDGTALVAGMQNFPLSTQLDASGVQHIFSQQGADITAKLTSGQLAGLLQMRDQKIPTMLSNLDTLAAGFANAINAAHHSGFDLNGNAGGDLFVAPPASGVGAAAGMAVAITDPTQIAAGSVANTAANPDNSQSNGNLTLIAAVHDQPVAAGKTATEYYANLVFGVGSDVANGTAEQDASGLIMRQLQDQRGSISGVSLDEEAANLVTYQNAYQASARVVTTINTLLDAAVNLGRY